MSKYEPTTELIMLLVDVKEYSTAASVELGFMDSFEGCADSIAFEILKSAQTGNFHGLESAVKKTREEIEFHQNWQADLTHILLKADHQNIEADCLKQAVAQTSNVRKSLKNQVTTVVSSLNSSVNAFNSAT